MSFAGSMLRRMLRCVGRGEFSAAGYFLGWVLLGSIPRRVALAVGNAGAVCAARWADDTQLRKNMARALGVADPALVPDSVVRAAWRSYARYWMEVFALPKLAQDPRVIARLDSSVQGVEYLDEALASGRGVVIVLTHSGNWDMAGLWLVHHAGGFSTVAERLSPEELFDAFVEYRESLGFEVLAHTGGGVPVMQVLEQRLRGGGIVCLLGERDLSGRGVAVPLLGELAHVPTGAARLVRDTGATLLTAECFFTPASAGQLPGWGMVVDAPVTPRDPKDVAGTTAQIMGNLGAHIARHPEDWHMLQPVFDQDVDSARLRRAQQRAQTDDVAAPTQPAEEE